MIGSFALKTVRPSYSGRPLRRRPVPQRRRLWPYVAPVVILIVLAVGWTWLWYYAASIADRALTGWIEREAAIGRVYACGTQSIGGLAAAPPGASIAGNASTGAQAIVGQSISTSAVEYHALVADVDWGVDLRADVLLAGMDEKEVGD